MSEEQQIWGGARDTGVLEWVQNFKKEYDLKFILCLFQDRFGFLTGPKFVSFRFGPVQKEVL